MRAPCSIEGCDRISQARGWCKVHYARWRATGDPTKLLGRRRRPAIERVMARTERQGECLVFTGHLAREGYGQVSSEQGRAGNVIGAHVVSCEAAHGPRPTPDHEVLHSCDNPPCVEPTHLRWGTRYENHRDAVERGRFVAPPIRWKNPPATDTTSDLEESFA